MFRPDRRRSLGVDRASGVPALGRDVVPDLVSALRGDVDDLRSVLPAHRPRAGQEVPVSNHDDPFRCAPECERMWQPHLVAAGIIILAFAILGAWLV